MATTHTGSPVAGQDNGSQGNGSIVGKMRERATAQLTAQKEKAVDGIGSVTQAVRGSTQQLRDQQHDTLAGYVERAADEIDRLSQSIRDKNVGELFEDAQRLARRQPALFIGSAFALGVLGARFLKSSSRPDYQNDEYGQTAYPDYPRGSSDYTAGTAGATDYTGGASGTATALGTSSTPGVSSSEGNPSSGATRTSRTRKSPASER